MRASDISELQAAPPPPLQDGRFCRHISAIGSDASLLEIPKYDIPCERLPSGRFIDLPSINTKVLRATVETMQSRSIQTVVVEIERDSSRWR